MFHFALPIELNGPFLGTVIAACVLIWGVVSFRLNRKNAAALERTRFVFENLRHFETDQAIQAAYQVVSGLNPDFTIAMFLELTKQNKGGPHCAAMETYLNFLWRVAYAHFVLKTITVDDLNAFGYYYYVISLRRELMEYCVREGFEYIVSAIFLLEAIWAEDERQNEFLIAKIRGRKRDEK
jgi:hypothetical protein